MIKPAWYPDDKQLRQFSVAALVGFPLIAWACKKWFFSHPHGVDAVAHSHPVLYWIAALGPIVCVLGLAIPGAVYPLYTALMALTMPIGWLVSNVFLRFIFYVILTPLGLVFKLMGRDPLVLKKPQASSYWVKHEQRADALGYYRQA